MAEQGPYVYTKSWSVEKPSSETHQWSFQRACEAAQADIEARWGVDYRITQISFVDDGRTTRTEHKWTCARKWRCTHTVTATYHIERRGSLRALLDAATLTDEMRITRVMLNEFHPSYVDRSEHEEIYRTEGGEE